MKHTIIGHQQGSAAWKEHRAKCFNASEAASMLGAGKYASRTELLDEKVTGLARDVSPQQQALYDRGHAAEAAARTLVEQKLGSDLYAITAAAEVDGMVLSASYDGLTIGKDVAFEHKLWNEALAAQVTAGELEPHYYWQLEQQLMIVGAERVIFVVSDGTPERFVSMEYRPVEGRREQLLAGWAQFHKDLEAHLPVVHKETPKGIKGEALGELTVRVAGSVVQSNLPEWRAMAVARIEAINKELKTDEDFGQAKVDVAWLEESARAVKDLKERVIAQMADVSEIIKTLDGIVKLQDRTRLDLAELVKRRETEVRGEVCGERTRQLAEYLSAEGRRAGFPITMADVEADFTASIKGKRTIKSLHDAADSHLARCKMAASALADRMQENCQHVRERAADEMHLFPDLGPLCRKLPEDFQLVVESRLTKHREQVAAAAARKAAEEKAAADRKAAEDAAAEQRRQEESARAAARDATTSGLASGPATSTQTFAESVVSQPVQRAPIYGDQVYHQGGPGGMGYGAPAGRAFVQDGPMVQEGDTVRVPVRIVPAGPPTLKLGTICERLGFTVTAAYLAELGYPGVKGERNSVVFHNEDFRAICAAIVSHVTEAAHKDWSTVPA